MFVALGGAVAAEETAGLQESERCSTRPDELDRDGTGLGPPGPAPVLAFTYKETAVKEPCNSASGSGWAHNPSGAWRVCEATGSFDQDGNGGDGDEALVPPVGGPCPAASTQTMITASCVTTTTTTCQAENWNKGTTAQAVTTPRRTTSTGHEELKRGRFGKTKRKTKEKSFSEKGRFYPQNEGF
jgi:hypothetical protein